MNEQYKKDIDELERKNAFWNRTMFVFMVIFALIVFGLVFMMFLSAF